MATVNAPVVLEVIAIAAIFGALASIPLFLNRTKRDE